MSPNRNHPRKGSSTKVAPIKNTKDIKAIRNLLRDSPRDHLLFVMGINTGLHVCDLLAIRLNDVRHMKAGQKTSIAASVSGKTNVLDFNAKVYEVAQEYFNYLEANGRTDRGTYLFESRKGGKPLSMSTLNALVKKWAAAIDLAGNYGALSLRKTWGYQQIKVHGMDIEHVRESYKHKAKSCTRAYLDLLGEEAGNDDIHTYGAVG